MRRKNNLYKYFIGLLYLLGLIIPWSAQAQSPVTIAGDITVCVGDTKVYTPGISNPALTYHWGVVAPASGTLLSGNHTGATIQWMSPGTANVVLYVIDPLDVTDTVYEGSLTVTIAALPSPFITTNVELGCQPLNEADSQRERPEFSPTNCQLVCEYSTVRYYANGDASSTYSWNIVGAISYTPSGSGDYCDVYWGAPGFGSVELTETTVNGCEATTSFCVEIIEGPQAMFETIPPGLPDPIEICLYSELVLVDVSTASASSPIVSYLWDWGDGHITPMSPGAVASSVSHAYDNPGMYTVTLTVVNSCGCSSSFSREVRVSEFEAPKIACPRVVCEGERAVYTIPDDYACAPSSWSVVGGTMLYADPVRVEVLWDMVDPNIGFGYVSYETCDPCRMTVVEPVPVVLQSAIIQGPAVICQGEQYVFRLPKWPSTEFNWSISGPAIIEPTDQRNEIAVRAYGTGLISLSCYYSNTVLGCEGKARLDIQVLPPEIINGPEAICQGDNPTFSLSGSNPGNWTLRTASGGLVASGTGTSFSSYTFTTPGNYRLSVTGTTFCPPEDHFIKVVATPAMPDVITGMDRACPAIPIRYDAGNPVSGTTFSWSVGSPGAGSPSAAVGDYSYITFSSLPANVNVQRVTTDGLGCASGTLSYYVDVAVPPLSIAGPDMVCHSSIESYALSYTDGDHYEWEIVDPLIGSVVGSTNTPTPDVQWNMPIAPPSGQYVWLIAKVTKCGVVHTDSLSVFVKGIPTITSITPSDDTICAGSSVSLNVTPSYAITSGTYEVNWGDGSPLGTYVYPASITHTYTGVTGPTVFTPTVTLVDPDGCVGTVTASSLPITVLPAPVGILSPTGPITTCAPVSETLNVTVTTGMGGSYTYTWVPAIAPPTSSSATATSFGMYYAVVQNAISGCSDTTNRVRIIDTCGGSGSPCPAAPAITFSHTQICGDVSITPSTHIAGGTWSINNPYVTIGATNPVTGAVGAFVEAAGAYTFAYTATYAPGCTRRYFYTVAVPYIPDLSSSISCNQAGGNYKITLHDHSTEYPAGAITNRDYYRVTPYAYLGSGMSVDVFQTPGTTATYYEVVSDGVNPACTSYVNVTTPVFPTLSIGLEPSVPYPGCVEDVVFKFNHTETGTITSHLWNFGDGSSNVGEGIPTMDKVYSMPGNMPVTLRVTDIYGCYAEDDMIVDVRSNPYDGNMTAAPNPACQGDVVTLTYVPAGGTSSPLSYAWYEQSTPLYTTTVPTYSVLDPGGYWVQGTGLYGCEVESGLVSVHITQVPPVSIIGNTGACVNQPFTLTTQDYGAGYTYVWSGAGTGSGTSLTQTLITPGTYTYYVQITETASGCSRMSAAFTVTVSTPPLPPSLSFDVLNCDPYELELTATGAAGTYNWSNGMTGAVINTLYGGDYQVTLTDLNGCVVQSQISVPKSLEEYIWVFPTGCFCLDNQREPYVIGPLVPLDTWAWIKDASWDVSGVGFMPPYYLTPGSVYNMYLYRYPCDITSGDMYYMSDTCDRLQQGAGNFGDPVNYQNDQLGIDHDLLEIAPNPAGDYAMAHFIVASGSKSRTIELVDITGRILQTHTLEGDKGSIRLDMSAYASGMYNVVLRRDGVVVQTMKLSKTD